MQTLRCNKVKLEACAEAAGLSHQQLAIVRHGLQAVMLHDSRDWQQGLQLAGATHQPF